MNKIDPPQLPKAGDEVEVAHEGGWQDAIVTKVTEDRVMGEVLNQRYPTGFSYTIASYRVHWKFR